MGLGRVLTRLRSYRVDANAIRAEAWALGGRHKGCILDGAIEESRAVDAGSPRAALLDAVIRTEGRLRVGRDRRP